MNNEESIQNDIEKLSALVEPPPQVLGMQLRPFTAGSLILLQIVKNPLLDGTANDDDLFFHVASFIYIHKADLSEVRKCIRNREKFEENVFKFAETFSVKDLIASAQDIKGIIEKSVAGLDYQVEDEGNKNPN